MEIRTGITEQVQRLLTGIGVGSLTKTNSVRLVPLGKGDRLPTECVTVHYVNIGYLYSYSYYFKEERISVSFLLRKDE